MERGLFILFKQPGLDGSNAALAPFVAKLVGEKIIADFIERFA